MILHTCSEAISLARQLEDKSANFYHALAEKYTKDSALFLSFARENQKNIVQVERSYYGVISDALEGCFAFDLEKDTYALDTDLAGDESYADAVSKAVAIEEKMIQFYSDAAEQSQSLMADVPRVFRIIARKKKSRIDKLNEISRS